MQRGSSAWDDDSGATDSFAEALELEPVHQVQVLRLAHEPEVLVEPDRVPILGLDIEREPDAALSPGEAGTGTIPWLFDQLEPRMPRQSLSSGRWPRHTPPGFPILPSTPRRVGNA